MATDQVRTAFRRGSARAERPPREGVCGTYFIRRNESKGAVLCVFKPVDEEATDIEMSPSQFPSTLAPSPFLGDSTDFSLGPAHGSASSLANSPIGFNNAFHRTNSLSSDSEHGSRTYRASGFHAGEGAYKEVAAYLLDHERFARVPQTALATCQFSSDVPEKNKTDSESPSDSSIPSYGGTNYFNKSERLDVVLDAGRSASRHSDDDGSMRTKMGAFQVYVENVGDADDYGPGVFDKDQVHRIAILDIRTLNHDRHGGNILVTKSESPDRRYDLVPIDHGYILPEVVQSVPWPVWMDWPMVKEQLSDRVKTYVEHLDADSEAHILDDELDGVLRPGSLRTLKIATLLLQKGVAAGLTLYDIGLLMYCRREDPYTRSELEKVVNEAEDAGFARERHIAEQEMPMSPAHPPDGLTRKHQSLNATRQHETYIDDYIVKYAGKRIQEIVLRVASMKKRENVPFASRSGHIPILSRARSIPDFGLGMKPMHAALTRQASYDPAPTPMSSPVSSPPLSSNDELETHLPNVNSPPARGAPIRIPINDGSIRRIAIPELQVPKTRQGHVRNRSVSGMLSDEVVRSNEQEKMSSVNLPPLFKSTSRKASPVAPLDVFAWGTGSP